MRKLFLFVIIIYISTTKVFGQNFWDQTEIGLAVGGMKYIGGEPSPATRPSASLLGKYLVNNKFAIRGQITAGEIMSNAGATPTINFPNSKEFKLAILSVTILPEYDFIDISTGENKWTPYVFAGLGYFYYSKTYVLNDETTNTNQTFKYGHSKVPPPINIPLGAGIKYGLSPYAKLFLEGNCRLYLHQEFYEFQLGMTFNLGIFKSKDRDHDPLNRRSNFKNSRQDCPPVYL